MGEPMSVVWRVLSRRKTPMSPEGREHSSSRTGSPLTVVDVTCLGVAVSLGTGVYVLLPRVAREEAGPAVVLSFLVAAVASCLAGEYSTMSQTVEGPPLLKSDFHRLVNLLEFLNSRQGISEDV
ncbi:high affinity cationic amino acid transporter 1-like [Dermacentor silvarum]|uniref:high affinity cationic amino acid transporter 1-like n=1 Tax=Dermacentor silvarum TaxID=543639 RepID=UPI0021010A67|nr:high affinity cationic amino acid transporter 1-like [Dermacentor silvarum]